MALPSYLREKNTGQVYKLGSGGYYQKVGDAGGQPVSDVNSVNDAYSAEAQAQTNPYYDQQSATTKTQSNADIASVQDKLKALYTDQGMGLSSFHTGAQTSAQNIAANNLSSRLADIERARTSEYQGRLDKYNSAQLEGARYDQAQEDARQAAIREQQKWEAEMAWEREKQAADMRMAELQYQTAKTSAASKSNASKNPTSAEIKSSLSNNIKAGLSDIISGGLQPWATEQMIDELYSMYQPYGYSKATIDRMVMDSRQPLEKQYRF